MELKLYDTLTREKRVFNPIDPARVRMYVCGPTVYDFAHIGNARPVIVFDVLYRLLRHLYGPEHVAYVRNITDVDDKINARATERGISIRELTEATYNNFKSDVAALGCLPPTVEPRATDYVSNPGAPVDMIRLIERLIKNGNAYAAEGHVLFDVPSMPDYGQLSKRPLDEMIAGSRVEVAPYKRDPQDFVLWKPSPPDLPGWDSPWGRGRPGWHIECSAMSAALLGETFDIHGGGIDLVFPHHENEIAQSRCAFHTGVMANYWMHNGFLQVEGEKMSKSLGNFVTIRELMRGWKGQAWSGAAARWTMLQTHYRQPIDWTSANLLSSRRELAEPFMHFRLLDHYFNALGKSVVSEIENELEPSQEVLSALCDDLNTPAAFAYLRAEKSKIAQDKKAAAQLLRDYIFLGIVSEPTRYIFSISAIGSNWPAQLGEQIAALSFDFRIARANRDEEFEKSVQARARQLGVTITDRGPNLIDLVFMGERTNSSKSIDDLVAARNAARARKDFKESDRIRDELAAMGVVLKDSKDGTTWEIAR